MAYFTNPDNLTNDFLFLQFFDCHLMMSQTTYLKELLILPKIRTPSNLSSSNIQSCTLTLHILPGKKTVTRILKVLVGGASQPKDCYMYCIPRYWTSCLPGRLWIIQSPKMLSTIMHDFDWLFNPPHTRTKIQYGLFHRLLYLGKLSLYPPSPKMVSFYQGEEKSCFKTGLLDGAKIILLDNKTLSLHLSYMITI